MFDDLTVEKYEVVYDPLDFDHIGMIVEKIAKYHALSLYMVENGHEELKEYKMVFTEEMKHMFNPMIRLIYTLTNAVKEWPGYEEIADKVNKFADGLSDKMFAMMKKDHSMEFNVLNHGDFHIRNLMFKRGESGELSEVLFLDFQMPNFNMPSFDFVGLLNSMGTEEVRRRENDLIKMYHRMLVENLKMFGFKGELPTIVDIQVCVLKMSAYNAFYTMVLGPMFRLRGIELSALFDPVEQVEVTNALNEVFKDPVFIEDMKLALNKYDSRGVFDD